MDEPTKKRVDESWKEQAEKEKQTLGQTKASPSSAAGASAQAAGSPDAVPPRTGRDAAEPQTGEAREAPPAQFDLFVSSLAMEAFIALGDIPHPVTRKQSVNVGQAKYLIDLLGILEQKTKGNLTVDEERLLKDALYQLRMRYMAKTGT